LQNIKAERTMMTRPSWVTTETILSRKVSKSQADILLMARVPLFTTPFSPFISTFISDIVDVSHKQNKTKQDTNDHRKMQFFLLAALVATAWGHAGMVRRKLLPPSQMI
jgi:hypothetical protein